MRLRRSLAALSLAVAALGSAACGTTREVRYTTAEEAFTRGQRELDAGRIDEAIQYFQGVFTFGRSDVSDDAQLGLARAYERSRQYLLAANAYRAFAETYDTDPRVPDAYLGRAQALERQTPNFELDQTDTRQALAVYQAYLRLFPTHARVPEAQARVTTLTDRLAQKAFATGALYERRGLNEAAGLSFEQAFNQYPTSAWADDALVGALRTFTKYAEQSVAARQGERARRALAAYDRLVQIFPASPLRAEADTWAQRARSAATAAP